MTPLYSKETAEDYIDAAHGRRELNYKGELAEINAIERLIGNGNEVMGLLEAGAIWADDSKQGEEHFRLVEELIKKIKGKS